MPDFIDGFEAFGRIRSLIQQKYGNQRNCAKALGISESHLSDMLNARCELAPVLLAAAGLVRRTVYQVISVDEQKDEPTPRNTVRPLVEEVGIDMPILKRNNP